MNAEILYASGKREIAKPKKGSRFDWRELQEIVGGTFDIQYLPKTGGKIVVRNDGKLVGLPINHDASRLWRKNYPIEKFPINNDGLIVGDVLVCDGKMV